VRVVLDTSVLVAAWKSSMGASFALLAFLDAGDFEIALSVPLVVEYEAVLTRHLSADLSAHDVGILLDQLCVLAKKQDIFFLWRPFLRDPDDDMVLELAVAAECDAIVTHNVRDFARADTLNVRVLSPAAFLRLLRGA
jgi:putative PIN family toxin of toxin-antitoxin system